MARTELNRHAITPTVLSRQVTGQTIPRQQVIASPMLSQHDRTTTVVSRVAQARTTPPPAVGQPNKARPIATNQTSKKVRLDTTHVGIETHDHHFNKNRASFFLYFMQKLLFWLAIDQFLQPPYKLLSLIESPFKTPFIFYLQFLQKFRQYFPYLYVISGERTLPKLAIHIHIKPINSPHDKRIPHLYLTLIIPSKTCKVCTYLTQPYHQLNLYNVCTHLIMVYITLTFIKYK